MFKYGGYNGVTLRVDLTARKTRNERLPEKWVEEFIGGKGLGLKLLYDELRSGVDPLGPENKLIFAVGPLNGTPVPCKYVVLTKSPLSGIFRASYAAGFFAHELKFAGYDAVIVQGVADKPVYVWAHDGKAEIRDATHLWGKLTDETQDVIKDELRDEKIRIACIGPAGERLVKFSAIVSEWRTAARGGLGAVMGSKKLKGIAVRGTKAVELKDPDVYREAVREINETLMKDPGVQSTSKYGTPGTIELVSMAQGLVTRNFMAGKFEGENEINGEAVANKIFKKKVHCYACPIGCTRHCVVKTGSYAGAVDGPEHETIVALGSACGNDNLESIAYANLLCDKYGLDTMSTGFTIAFGMECYEKGIITKEDTGGIELKFGNHESLIQVIHKICKREGLGDILAEGVKRASRRIGRGAERFAIHVKGIEGSNMDPRAFPSMALAYATADHGWCHLESFTTFLEIGGLVKSGDVQGIARVVKEMQDSNSIYGSLVLCLFAGFFLKLDHFLKLLVPATGMDLDTNKLRQIAERIWNLGRDFNVREGIGRKDDTLPDIFFQEPIEKYGPLSREEFNKMLDAYYKQKGWSVEGKPLL